MRKELGRLQVEEPTEIVFILDKSGSMNSIKNDAIGGFNSFLKEQKKIKERANFSLILFNDEIETLISGVDINEVEELNDSTYIPSGMTSLLDAIGTGIDSLNARLKNNNKTTTKVVFAIMTDGEENTSKEYNEYVIKEKIEKFSKENDWQFIFLGANIDAVSTANKFGINSDYVGQFSANGNGSSTAILNASKMMHSYRVDGNMSTYQDVSELDKSEVSHVKGDEENDKQ